MATDIKVPNVIFFVDDEPQVLKAVGQTLGQLENCQIYCFEGGKSCLDALGRQACNLVIADVNMPKMDGLKLLEQIKRIRPKLDVILLTGYGDVPMAVKAIKAGAIDFIEKPLDEKTFLPMIEAALERSHSIGKTWERLLTKSEIEIIKRVVQGKSNKETAAELRRSVRTVENHRYRLMIKLDVRNTAELVTKALDLGICSL